MLSGPLALATASAFAGAALYVSIVEQPARLGLDDKTLLAEWKLNFARGFTMPAILVVVSALLGLRAADQASDWHWIIGAVLILLNLPFTLLGIMPTNIKLNSIAPDAAGPTSRALIEAWGRLHAIRTCLGIASVFAYLWALS